MGRQIKITKLTKERTIQHLLNVCFADKKRSEFCLKPANQNQTINERRSVNLVSSETCFPFQPLDERGCQNISFAFRVNCF